MNKLSLLKVLKLLKHSYTSYLSNTIIVFTFDIKTSLTIRSLNFFTQIVIINKKNSFDKGENYKIIKNW